jgi:DNA-binding IscR family transcriptional regulator
MSTLSRLLVKIQSGGTFEVAALAAELGTSTGIIEAMLEHLQRQGLVRACSQSRAACSSCGLSTSCGIESGSGLRVWQSVHHQPTGPGGRAT